MSLPLVVKPSLENVGRHTTARRPVDTIAGLPQVSAFCYAGLLIVGLLLYGAVWPDAPYVAADTEGYRVVAEDLLDGRLDHLHFRSVGYPLLMLATGSARNPARALFYVGLVLHFASIWMMGSIVFRLGFGAAAVILFGLFLSLPPFVEPASQVMSENLTQFLLVSIAVTSLRFMRTGSLRWAIVIGLVIATAAHVRPTFQFLSPLLGAVFVGLAALLPNQVNTRQVLRGALVTTVVAALGIAAVAGYNFARFGMFTISAGNLGYSMTTKTVRVLERIPDEYALEREILIQARDEHLVQRGSSHTAEQYWPTASDRLQRATGKTPAELLAFMSQMNFLLIRQAPLSYLWETARSFPSYWFPAVTSLSYGSSPAFAALWMGLHFAWAGFFWLQLTMLASVVLLALSRSVRVRPPGSVVSAVEPAEVTVYLVGVTLVLYTMLVSCIVHHGNPRFRVPTDIVAVALCFIGARIWWRWSSAAVRPSEILP